MEDRAEIIVQRTRVSNLGIQQPDSLEENEKKMDRKTSFEPLAFTKTQPINIYNMLKNREYGLNHASFNLELLRLKTSQIKINYSKRATYFAYRNQNIVHLKGGTRHMFALYESFRVKKANHWYFLAEVPHISTNYVPFGFDAIKNKENVTDFCDLISNTNSFMYISNLRLSGIGRIVVFDFPSDPNHTELGVRPRVENTHLWCCCSNSFKKSFAIGCKDFITVEDNTARIYKNVAGNVHSVQFNDLGNTVYCGVDTGNVTIVDLRADIDNDIIDIYNTGIDETLLTSDQRTLICGSFEGQLCKLDLRQRRPVLEYNGHVHTGKKVPFSISESMKVLCATGTDNLTRLWSLDAGGDPLQIIQPPNIHRPHRSWLINQPNSAILYLVQGNRKFKYDIKISN